MSEGPASWPDSRGKGRDVANREITDKQRDNKRLAEIGATAPRLAHSAWQAVASLADPMSAWFPPWHAPTSLAHD